MESSFGSNAAASIGEQAKMTLDPQAKRFLDDLAQQNAPGWNEMSPSEGREIFASRGEWFGKGAATQRIQDRLVGADVAVRIFTPVGTGPFPALVYFHGGGWVLGDLDSHDTLCQRLAASSEAVVVAVHYRRSPEATFPDALDDCYAATQFVSENAKSLQVDAKRIVVGGDSAGGNLAAAVALKARDSGGPPIALQLLIYPVLDHRCNSESYHQFADGYGLTKTIMEWFWEQYLGEEGNGADPLASPLLANDLANLPPAHILTAEYDVLRDEGAVFAQKLTQAGIPTTYRQYDGMIHGFVHLAGVFDGAQAATNDIGAVIRSL